MKKAVFFDLDGTILNTAGDLATAVNEGLKGSGLPERNREEIIGFLGNGWERLVELAAPPGTDEDTKGRVLFGFEEYYRRYPDTYTVPYEGITELLTGLKRGGVQTAVVSNKGNEVTQILMKKFFPGLIDMALGVTPERPRKPASDMVEHVMETLGVTSEEVVYVGDSAVDYHTAINADLDCILVRWGFETEDNLRILKADIADTPQDLTKKLQMQGLVYI